MDPYEGRHSQYKISIDLSIPLAAVNRMIVKCTSEGRCTASRSGHQIVLCILLREM